MSQQAVALSVEPKRAAERAGSAKSFVAHAKLIGFFTLISRVLGLGRGIVAGHHLCAGLLFGRNIRPDWLLTLKLTAIMLPYVLLICGTAFLSGILQVHRRFGVPAAAPIILNVCHIVVVFLGARLLRLNPKADPSALV